jgi:GNAT superfamily N-acetyltransferase
MRPISEADHAGVLQLLSENEEALHGRPARVGMDDLRHWLARTEPATDTWLVEDEQGIAAAGWANASGDLADGVGFVHPRAAGRGLGGRLVERSEAWARERGSTRIRQFVFGKDAAGARLMRDHRYRDVRHFFTMAIQLERPPDVPDAPVEVVREQDARAFHEALEDAFREQWGRPVDSFEQWWRRHRANPSFDLSLWFLIRDGDTIVAVARTEANRHGGGYVGALGVRRPYRGRGYAKALLHHAFREFWRRGLPRVTLDVDTQNETGATQLYERVGMHVEMENVVFERELEG